MVLLNTIFQIPFAQTISKTLARELHKNAYLCASAIGELTNENKDIHQCVKELKRDGVTVLPHKINKDFVEKSKDLCMSAWEDGLQRVKAIKGHDMKVICHCLLLIF